MTWSESIIWLITDCVQDRTTWSRMGWSALKYTPTYPLKGGKILFLLLERRFVPAYPVYLSTSEQPTYLHIKYHTPLHLSNLLLYLLTIIYVAERGSSIIWVNSDCWKILVDNQHFSGDRVVLECRHIELGMSQFPGRLELYNRGASTLCIGGMCTRAHTWWSYGTGEGWEVCRCENVWVCRETS